MAAQREYGWYLRGRDLAIVEIDIELNASNPVDNATWGSPKKTIAEKYSPGLLAPLARKRKANLKAAADKKRRDRNMERPAKKKRKQRRTGRQY